LNKGEKMKKIKAKKVSVKIAVTVKPKGLKTDRPMMVSIVLDETGSMSGRIPETISGFNEYVGDLKKLKVPVSVTLTKFNSKKVEVVYADKLIKDVPLLNKDTYLPNELTPLYDAIGKTISEISKQELGKKTVLVVIITDGEENASKEYDQKKIFDLISEKQKKDGWTFVFMGADQDAWLAGRAIGVLYANTLSFDGKNVKGAMKTAARATMGYANSSARAGGMSHKSFFKKQKI
jgi:hypothetical protein